MLTGEPQVTCLFIHGWAMNSSVWEPVQALLPDWIDATTLDLPGHGQRQHEAFSSLQDLTTDLQKHCAGLKKNNRPLILIGWSLGALPCLQLCINQFEIVDALVVVSSNPSFVSRENWQYGIEAKVFEDFAASLKDDFSGTIRRFLSLQVKGSDSGRVVLRDLREKILQQAQPDESSLDVGLQLLKQVDLHQQLPQIKQPISWVLGGQDGLVKVELAEALKELMPRAEINVVKKAGHAPFLSHSEAFAQDVTKFASALLNKQS